MIAVSCNIKMRNKETKPCNTYYFSKDPYRKRTKDNSVFIEIKNPKSFFESFCLMYTKGEPSSFLGLATDISPRPIPKTALDSLLRNALDNNKAFLDLYAESNKKQIPSLPDFLEELRLSCGTNNPENRKILTDFTELNC